MKTKKAYTIFFFSLLTLLLIYISFDSKPYNTTIIKKQIVYQIDNYATIKLILENDIITKMGIREDKSTKDYQLVSNSLENAKEKLIESYKEDVEFFEELKFVYLTSKSINFVNLINEDGYIITVSISNDFLDPKYDLTLETGYSLTSILDLKKINEVSEVSKILEYYGISQANFKGKSLSYSKLLDDMNFRFYDVLNSGMKYEINLD